MNWILQNIRECIMNFIDGIFEMIALAVNTIFVSGAELAEHEDLVGAYMVVGLIAFSLVSLVVMKQIFSIYIMETDGDPDSNPLDLLTKAAIAIALISCNAAIYSTMLNFATTFGNELFSSLEPVDIVGSIRTAREELFAMQDMANQLISPFFVLIYLVGTTVLCIKAGIRGAELCLMKILFPFFCCDIISSRRERWNAFFTSYLVTMVGYTLQILCFRLSGNQFSRYCGGEGGMERSMFAYAFLYLAIKAPKWLEKFIYTSGLGQSVGGGARSAAFMLPNLLRMIK